MKKAINLISSVNKVAVGMFVCQDLTICQNPTDKKVIAVVTHFDACGFGEAVCLDEECLKWALSDHSTAHTKGVTSGWEATNKILSADNLAFPAAAWCASYQTDGLPAGVAYLPTRFELAHIEVALDKINSALRQVNATPINGTYWSSTHTVDFDGSGQSMVLELAEHRISRLHFAGLRSRHNVRPMFAFKIQTAA